MVQGWCWHCSWQGQISGWKEQGRQERNFGGIPSRAGSLCMTQSTYFRTHLLGQNRSSWQHLSKGEVEKCSLFLFPKKATCPAQNQGSDIKESGERAPWDGQLATAASRIKIKEKQWKRRQLDFHHLYGLQRLNAISPDKHNSDVYLREREKTGENDTSFSASRRQPKNKKTTSGKETNYVLIPCLPQAAAHISSYLILAVFPGCNYYYFHFVYGDSSTERLSDCLRLQS